MKVHVVKLFILFFLERTVTKKNVIITNEEMFSLNYDLTMPMWDEIL